MYIYVNQYTVKPGDTLDSIARNSELLSFTQILRVNKEIINPNFIYPGQVINIPKFVPLSTYIVRPGDTLANIVYNYNKDLMEVYGYQITFDEVLAYNPGIVNPNVIYPSMIIYLPEIL